MFGFFVVLLFFCQGLVVVVSKVWFVPLLTECFKQFHKISYNKKTLQIPSSGVEWEKNPKVKKETISVVQILLGVKMPKKSGKRMLLQSGHHLRQSGLHHLRLEYWCSWINGGENVRSTETMESFFCMAIVICVICKSWITNSYKYIWSAIRECVLFKWVQMDWESFKFIN